MAPFVVNPTRFDPYKNFKFRVIWDGVPVAGVSKVSALKRTTEVVKHREGGDPSTSRQLPGKSKYEAVTLEGADVSLAIREEWVSGAASRVAAIPEVRKALLERQRAFRQPPGLVADGRDMGSVVFPDATLKIFLTADPAERARRRYKQLMEKGLSASMNALLQEIRERDARDTQRAEAPLRKCPDAIELDTTGVGIEAAVERILELYRQRATQAP